MGPCFSSSASPCLLVSGHKGLLRLGRSWPAGHPPTAQLGHSSSKRDSEGHLGSKSCSLEGVRAQAPLGLPSMDEAK